MRSYEADAAARVTEPAVVPGNAVSVYHNPDYVDTFNTPEKAAANTPAPAAPAANAGIVASVPVSNKGKDLQPEPSDTAKNAEPPLATITRADSAEAEPAAMIQPGTVKIMKEVNPAPVSDNSDAGLVNAAMTEDMDPVIGKYAQMISVEPGEINNYMLYRFIDDWYGTEYKWGGDDKTGIDCSGFSKKLYAKVYGVELQRTAREQRRTSEHLKHIEDAEQGDLVFFRVRHIRISHVGVYLANGYFVHASRSQGVMISNLNSRYWRRRFAGCGRVARTEQASESDMD